jgi:anti-sigma B factor antagonist
VSALRRGPTEVDECWVAIEGELDDGTSQRLRDQLRALIEEGCRQLVVDLRGAVAIESSGVGVLIDALRALEELGGSLAVRPPPRQVYELARVRRLGELLAAANDAVEEAEAIRRLDRLFS